MELRTASFSGHESFPFRHAWLTKGVQYCAADPSVFSREDAMVELGVGKNMVQSIRHWCLACRLLEEDSDIRNNRGRRLRPTAIGSRLFAESEGWDPYLEDTGTLWLVHWRLATNTERATTWAFAFNLMHQPEFSRLGLEQALVALARRLPDTRVNRETIKRDIDVFIRTYVGRATPTGQVPEDSLDCPLTELTLLFEQEQHGLYAFARGPKDSLPDAVLIHAIGEFASWQGKRTSLTFDELAYGSFSPGGVFKLDESSLAERLDRLAGLTNSAWQFSETAGLKQVLFRRDVDIAAILDDYYRRLSVGRPGDQQ